MPPPVPPRVNDGRMIAGRPMSSSASSACAERLDLVRARRRQPDLGHGVAEQLAVFRLVDRFRGRADHLDVELVEHAHLLERQRGVERGLSAHGRQDGVGALLLDDLGDDLRRDRLDIGRVGEVRIGHDRGRVRIHQHDPVALFLEGLAGLGAGIVELAGLADDDRAGANDQDRLDVRAFRHRASIRHKKRARFCASFAPATGSAPREGCLDQNQAPANPGMPSKTLVVTGPFCKALVRGGGYRQK